MAKSKHIVGFSRGVDTVTGELIINTDLEVVDGYGASLASAPVAAACTAACVKQPQGAGEKVKLKLLTVKADGVTAGDVAALVSWWAEGR